MVKKVVEIPEGIKILAFLFFAGSLASLMFGGIMFSLADGIRTMDPATLAVGGFDQSNFWIVILVGIFLVAASILGYFLGKGLLSGRNWSKIVVGVIAIFGVISSIANLADGFYAGAGYGIVFNGVILWYLFVAKDIKKFFR